MAVDDPLAIDGLELSALEFRRAMSGLLMHDTDPVSARPGVLSGCGVTVAGLTATVGAGQVVITPQAGSNGSYIAGLTATALAITAQDATYARIDRVVARIYDDSIDGSGQNKAAVEIITGTPSATPAAPALPAGALELAQLQVPKVGSAIVVLDRRSWTVANGGTLWVPDLPALQAVTPLRPGIKAVIGSGSGLAEYVWDGTGWRLMAVAPIDWTAVTLAAGFTAPDLAVAVRRGPDGMIHWRGGVASASWAAPGVYTVIAAAGVPAWARPAGGFRGSSSPLGTSTGALASAEVNAGGALTIRIITAAGAPQIYLNGLRYKAA